MSDGISAITAIGVEHYARGEYALAAATFTQITQMQPNAVEAYISLAEIFRAMGNLEKATESCQAALRLAPSSPEALNNLGMIYSDQGRGLDAIQQFELSLRESPAFEAAHINLGAALLEERRFDEAQERFTIAIECDANSASAHNSLGQLLLLSNRPEDAVMHAAEAARLEPENAIIYCNLANTLRCLGREAEATAAYRRASELDPGLAETHIRNATKAIEEDRSEEAILFLQRAVELDRENHEYWRFLATYQQEQEDFREAATCWSRVVELTPHDPDARTWLGTCLHRSGRRSEALRCLDFVNINFPEFPNAYLARSSLQNELGDFIGAEASLRRLANIDPPMAYAGLGILLGNKIPEDDFAKLQQYAEAATCDKRSRPFLLYSIGAIYDSRREYKKATRYVIEANALRHSEAKDKHRTYDPMAFEKMTDSIIKAFDRSFFSRLAEAGLETRKPVFVFGFPRSGTTLVEQIISSHSGAYGGGELTFAHQSFKSIPFAVQRPETPIECIKNLDIRAISALAERHLHELTVIADRPVERIVDKMPDNYSFLGLLAVMFPRATFIHCVRDLRDVAVSCWMSDFDSIKYSWSPQDLAHRITQYSRLIAHWRRVLTVKIHEVRYESLVTETERIARVLISACGLEWEPGCLAFHRNPRPVSTASVTQVRRPIYETSVGRWRHYDQPLAELFALLSRNEQSFYN